MAHPPGERDKPATKINGKFYPLQHQEWLKACRELKPAEKDVLFYLRTLDPFGEKGLELSITEIAIALGRDKGTVSRALKVLDREGWIDLELIRVRVRLTSRSRNDDPEGSKPLSPDNTVVSTQQSCAHTTPVVSTQLQLSPHNSSCAHTTPVAPTQRSTPETPTPKDFENPKTLKTLKTNKTLSEAREREVDFCLNKIAEVDREKFLQFARSKAQQLPDPPQLIEKWIATHIDWIKQEFDKAYPQKPFPTEEDKGSGAVRQSKNSMGWTLEDIKRIYPCNWRDAATYHGFNLTEEED